MPIRRKIAKSPKRRLPSRPTPKPRAVKQSANIEFATPSDVELVRIKGTPQRGGGAGGEAWRIDFRGRRAGIIFVNLIAELPLGEHASIQIYLNASNQGRHIGRLAYRKACSASAHASIYAHMRKSNIASIRAAEEAGFVDATPPGEVQKIMVCHK